MIRLDLTPRPVLRIETIQDPAAVQVFGIPVARLDLADRPVSRLRLPEFPQDLTEDFIAMNGDFVFMTGEKIWM